MVQAIDQQEKAIQSTAAKLAVLGKDVRLYMYRYIMRSGTLGTPVSKVQAYVKVPASTLSHHLRLLVEAGLVRQEVQGTTRLCFAEFRAMNDLIHFLQSECCQDQPDDKARTPIKSLAQKSLNSRTNKQVEKGNTACPA